MYGWTGISSSSMHAHIHHTLWKTKSNLHLYLQKAPSFSLRLIEKLCKKIYSIHKLCVDLWVGFFSLLGQNTQIKPIILMQIFEAKPNQPQISVMNPRLISSKNINLGYHYPPPPIDISQINTKKTPIQGSPLNWVAQLVLVIPSCEENGTVIQLKSVFGLVQY